MLLTSEALSGLAAWQGRLPLSPSRRRISPHLKTICWVCYANPTYQRSKRGEKCPACGEALMQEKHAGVHASVFFLFTEASMPPLPHRSRALSAHSGARLRHEPCHPSQTAAFIPLMPPCRVVKTRRGHSSTENAHAPEAGLPPRLSAIAALSPCPATLSSDKARPYTKRHPIAHALLP
jgi:hypothetical protein